MARCRLLATILAITLSGFVANGCGGSSSSRVLDLTGQPYCFLPLSSGQVRQLTSYGHYVFAADPESYCLLDSRFNQHFYSFQQPAEGDLYRTLARQASVLNGEDVGGQVTPYEDVLAQVLVAYDKNGNLFKVYRRSGGDWVRAVEPLSHKLANRDSVLLGIGKFVHEVPASTVSLARLAPFNGKIVVFTRDAQGRLHTSLRPYAEGPSPSHP